MAQKTTRPAKIDPDSAEEKSAAKKKDGKLARLKANGTQAELMRMTLKACLIARDATFNVQDLLTNSSRMAFLAIRDCEKELTRSSARSMSSFRARLRVSTRPEHDNCSPA